MRRGGRRNSRRPVALGRRDPFVQLAATRAWKADDAVDNGSVTTSLPSYVGAALSLTAHGTGQAIKAASPQLGNMRAIAGDGVLASGGYGAVIYGAAPLDLTLASVVYVASAAMANGLANVTVGDVAVSGVDHSYSTGPNGIRCRKTGGPVVDVTAIAPRAYVLVTIFSATSTTSYVNSLTPVSVADATAVGGTKLNVMCLAVNSGVLQGSWATTGYWTRALSAAEAVTVMTLLGQRYGVAIAP